MQAETVELLVNDCPLFAGLNKEETSTLLQSVGYTIKHFAPAEFYATTGSPCRYADILISGEMKAYMIGPSSKQAQISRLKAGTMMSPAFIFANDNSIPVTVEVVTSCTVMRMLPYDLQQLMALDHRIAMNFIRLISNTNAFLSNKLKMLALFSVREKVADFLIKEAITQGTRRVTVTRSRQEIADMLGIQKFSLIRCLNEFQERGAISIDGKTINIINSDKMR